jgi:signal transduction histidine kinase
LHDEVAQTLSGAGLQLDLLRMDLERQVPEIATLTAEVQNLLDRAARQIRDLSRELHPDIVEHAGLQAALELLVNRFQQEFKGKLRLTYSSSVRLATPAAVAMERIAHEAVVNAVRHGRCSRIDVVFEDGVLEIRDNGCGFDPALAPCGLGLPMMEYCASKASLDLEINGRDKDGTTITVSGKTKGKHAVQCSSC